MLKFLERMPLNRKLAVMLLIPCLGLIWFGGREVGRTLSLKAETDGILQLVDLSTRASALVHNLQKERGASAGYLGDAHEQFREKLPAQHAETDPKAADLRAFLGSFDVESFGPELESKLEVAMTELDKLPNMRTQILGQTVSTPAAIGYYTQMNASFLNVINDLGRLSSVAEVSTASVAYVNYLRSKERAGIERAVMSNVFAAGKFHEGYFVKFSELVSSQTTYANAFLALASPEQIASYEEIMANPLAVEVDRMRQVAFSATDKLLLSAEHTAEVDGDEGFTMATAETLVGGGLGVDPVYWFETMTGKINLLKDLEDRLSADLTDMSVAVRNRAALVAALAAGGMLVTLVFSIALAWLFTRAIVRPIGTARAVANRISGGDLSGEIEILSNDDIGQLLQDMKEMQMKLISVIEEDVQSMVEAGGRGDLSQRIDLAGKEGFYRKMSSGINDLLDVSERVVNDTVAVLGAMANGDLSTTIETEYEGSFDRLKQDANATIRRLSDVIEQDVQVMVDSARTGNLTQRIDLTDKNGFYEKLSGGVNDLVALSEQINTDVCQVFAAMASGDLCQKIETEYEGSFGQLKQDANATVANLIEVVNRIQEASSSVKSGAEQLSSGNQDLSIRTEEQAANLEETAASMEEMTSAVKQNAENVDQANQLAQAACEQAEQGGEVVGRAVTAMGEINTSSTKIADIIGVIDEIAFQTNLLALNASVEAARAGDEGRGFAVVASEVRNLAGRSAEAAKEIKELIQDSVRRVSEGSQLVNESGETLGRIVTGIKKVTAVVGEIALATKEQSIGIEEVNKAVMQMETLTQQNAALVEEAAAVSETLGEEAKGLDDTVSFFQVPEGVATARSVPTLTLAPAAPPVSKDPAPSGVESAAREPEVEDLPRPTPVEVPRPTVAPQIKRAVGDNNDVRWTEF